MTHNKNWQSAFKAAISEKKKANGTKRVTLPKLIGTYVNGCGFRQSNFSVL